MPRVLPAALAILLLAGVTPVRAGLDDLQWLIGKWKREGRSGTVYEEWTRLGDRVFQGQGYGVKREPGSPVVPLEDLLLVEMGGEVFYVAKPGENPYPVAFRLVALEGRSVAFENPQHDFPQRISYRLGEDGSTLLATAEGPGEADGAPRRLEFRFVRE